MISRKILQFAAVLRRLGVKCGTAEVIDALNALEHCDFTDKWQFRETLRATMVKSAASSSIFDTAFERFFAQTDQTSAPTENDPPQGCPDEGECATAAAPQEQPIDMAAEKVDMTADRYDDFEREFVQKSLSSGPRPTRYGSLVERLVAGRREFWKRRLADQEDPRFDDFDFTGNDELDRIILDSRSEIFDKDTPILYEDMKNFREQDFGLIHRIVKRMARRLSTRAGRRYKATRKSHRVDLRRTARMSIQTGGSMLRLAYKSPRKRKTSLILLCDVSGSMSRYATFVVSFIYGLKSSIRHLDSFVFSEDLEPLGRGGRNPDASAQAAELINMSDQWGKTTNIGQAVKSLRTGYKALLSSKTVVIILSDTRTMHTAEAVREMRKLARAVKKILWLNPIPRARWKDVPSVRALSKETIMVECFTLKQLGDIFRRQLILN